MIFKAIFAALKSAYPPPQPVSTPSPPQPVSSPPQPVSTPSPPSSVSSPPIEALLPDVLMSSPQAVQVPVSQPSTLLPEVQVSPEQQQRVSLLPSPATSTLSSSRSGEPPVQSIRRSSLLTPSSRLPGEPQTVQQPLSTTMRLAAVRQQRQAAARQQEQESLAAAAREEAAAAAAREEAAAAAAREEAARAATAAVSSSDDEGESSQGSESEPEQQQEQRPGLLSRVGSAAASAASYIPGLNRFFGPRGGGNRKHTRRYKKMNALTKKRIQKYKKKYTATNAKVKHRSHRKMK